MNRHEDHYIAIDDWNQQNPAGLVFLNMMRRTMSETTRGSNQDRARVAGEQDHEVRYEANKEHVSKDDVRSAIKSVGNSREKVEDKLDRKR